MDWDAKKYSDYIERYILYKENSQLASILYENSKIWLLSVFVTVNSHGIQEYIGNTMSWKGFLL